jgi:hypothetical protein
MKHSKVYGSLNLIWHRFISRSVFSVDTDVILGT